MEAFDPKKSIGRRYSEDYPIYVENDGLDKLEPERVKLSTDKYKSDSNVIMEFFNETLEKSPEETIVFNNITKAFKVWYTNNYNDKKLLHKKILKKYFEDNNYKFTSSEDGNIIQGLKFKNHAYVEFF